MRTHFLEGRKREERVSELGNLVRHKRGLTNWRGGRGSGLVSLEKRGKAKKGAQKLGGGEGEGRGGGDGKRARHKPGSNSWGGRRGRRRVGEMGKRHGK